MMEQILSLTPTGELSGIDTVSLSTYDLLKFLAVYPEIAAHRKVRPGELQKYLVVSDFNLEYCYTTLNLRPLYTAIAAWLEVVIKTALKNNVTPPKIILRTTVGSDFQINEIVGGEAVLDKEYMLKQSTALGFNFARKLQDVSSPNVIHNVELLRKVVNYANSQ